MKIDVSIGELIDKLSFLSIKLEKITDQDKLKNVNKEFKLIKRKILGINTTTSSSEFINLREVNLRLWNIEDKIRICESKKIQ